MKETTEKPLFVPLKREWFQAFQSGEKSEECRPHGPRWNERTCQIGRRVTLCLGYGKKHRLSGIVVSFRVEINTEKIKGWRECYGTRPDPAACIGIKLT